MTKIYQFKQQKRQNKTTKKKGTKHLGLPAGYIKMLKTAIHKKKRITEEAKLRLGDAIAKEAYIKRKMYAEQQKKPEQTKYKTMAEKEVHDLIRKRQSQPREEYLPKEGKKQMHIHKMSITKKQQTPKGLIVTYECQLCDRILINLYGHYKKKNGEQQGYKKTLYTGNPK